MDEKEKIVNYSRDVFLRNGFYKITMDDLAKGMRVSKKTIYKYFKSKNELVDAALQSFQENTKRRVNILVSEHENAIIKIRALADFIAILSYEINQQLLVDIQNHAPKLWQKIEDFRANVIGQIWTEIINKGKKDKCIIDKPNDIIIKIILSSIREVINPKFLQEKKYSIEYAFNIAIEILITGILTPKGLEIYKKLEQRNQNESL